MDKINCSPKMDIKNTELLVAAGKGECESVRRLINDNADANFTDRDGNTTLHYAIKSGCPEVVKLLLPRVKDVSVENNSNETAFDFAYKMCNKDIVELLGEEIVEKSFTLLSDSVVNKKLNDPSPLSSDRELSRAEKEIQNAKEKIEFCLESLQKLNTTKSKAEELSYEQANVFIYFVEVFSLEGSGGNEIKKQMKDYFCQYFTIKDWDMISDVRMLLLKKTEKSENSDKPARKLRLQDVRKFVKGDISSCFEKMEKYVEHVHQKQSSNINKTELRSFLNKLEGSDRNLGERITDVKSFLSEEFKMLIIAGYGKELITPERLFNFTMNFYPAFKNETNSDLKELADLRNKLIHQFHKYGCVKFGNEIYSLRSTLFKYYYAKEVRKIFDAMPPDENPGTLEGNLETELQNFKKRFRHHYTTETIISQEEAKGFIGYEFSQSVFPERDDAGVEELVDQYLKFMVIFDCEKNDDDLSDTEQEEGSDWKQRRELNDVDRREVFEKFDRLKKIKKYCSMSYDDEKRKMRDKLVNRYGINDYSFDNVCKSYVENNEEFLQKDKTSMQEIAKTISNLKKMKDKCSLSNEDIIYVYNQHLQKHKKSDSTGNKSAVGNADLKLEEKIKIEIPRDKMLDISVGKETFRISTAKIINNMLKTFYNAFHKYRVEFNIKEIFNDEMFLSFLVREETKEKGIADLVDPYFELMILIECEKQKDVNSQQNCSCVGRRDLFEKFHRLKKSRSHLNDKDYAQEEEKLYTEIIDGNVEISRHQFEKICYLYIKNFDKLQKDLKQIEKIKIIINKFKSLGFSEEITISLLKSVTYEQKGIEYFKECDNLLQNLEDPLKKKVKDDLRKIYNDVNLGDANKVRIATETESFEMFTRDFVLNMLAIFEEERQLKNPAFTYLIIKKLRHIGYCTPYIAKLITEVKHDDMIEKQDFIRLVKGLLMKKELYISSFHELLNVKSGKVNIYDEFIATILENGLDVESMKIVFQEPVHLQEISRTLCKEIEQTDNEQRIKIVQLTKNILKFLNTIAYELYCIKSYDHSSKILTEAQKVTEKLVNGRLIPKNDLLMIVTNCQTARIKNQQARMKKDHENRSKFREEALSDFDNARIALLENMDCDEARIQFLLVLAEIAYTKHLLGKYEESFAEHVILYQEVIKFVFDLPNRENSPNISTKEFFNDIEKSRKYQKLLSFPDESKTSLNILHMRRIAASDKYLLGEIECSKENYDKALEFYREALKIFKEEYYYRKKYQGPVGVIIPVLKHLARVYELVGLFWRRCGDSLQCFEEALRCYHMSLQKSNECFEVEADIFCPDNPAVIKIRRSLMYSLENTAYTLNMIGKKPEYKEGKEYFKKSLKIYEKLYLMWAQIEGELPKKTLDIMLSIGKTYQCLGALHDAKTKFMEIFDTHPDLNSKHDPAISKFRKLLIEASENIAYKYNMLKTKEDFENALEIYEKLYHVLIHLNGETDDKTLQIMTSLGYTYRSLKMLDKAEEIMKKVHHNQKELFGEDHAKTKKTLHIIASISRQISKRNVL